MAIVTFDERKALGAFVSDRRKRLQPDKTDLTPGSRRTPGLRREEVAALAGVSVSWYTWLEQGRDINVSAAALERLGKPFASTGPNSRIFLRCHRVSRHRSW